jgi:GT2 family glycosyltransferase
MSEVTISIVSYCQKALLDRCLGQIYGLSLPAAWRTVVVDNNSSDGSAEMVAQCYAWVKLIKMRKNAGFAGGHNAAYSQTDSPIFIILNPDVKILPGSLEVLVEAFEKFPKAAVVGPQLLNPDGSLQFSARRFYDWKTVLGRRLPFPGGKQLSDLHLMKNVDHSAVRCVDWVLGAAMGIRRSAFGGKELFDTRYKLYFEDVDLCYFAHKRGWDVLYCPQSIMIHDHQRTSAKAVFSSALINHFVSWLKFYLKTKIHGGFTTAGNKSIH